jgi:hypothetical protein
MGEVTVGATVSVDGFIADDNDAVGPLFDCCGCGEVAVTMGDQEWVFQVSPASADHIRSTAPKVGAAVIGRRLFDIANGRIRGQRRATTSSLSPTTHGSRGCWAADRPTIDGTTPQVG